MIKVLIVDDEPLARENLVLRIAGQNDFEICGQADNGHDAVLLAQTLAPDVIFLDINMPGKDGLTAANQLMDNQNNVLVFVTAYSEHAIDAFRVDALDYVVKPIDDKIFAETIKRVRDNVSQKSRLKKISKPHDTYLKRLGIKDNSTIHMIDVNDIEFIEVAGDYLCITALGKNYIHKQTLKSILSLLDPDKFLRIHRSTVINISFIDRIETNNRKLIALLKSKKQLHVSRRYAKTVREQISSSMDVHR